MHIYTAEETDKLQIVLESMRDAEGDAYFCSVMPPLFTMPEKLVRELSEHNGSDTLYEQWQLSLTAFEKYIKKQHLTLVLLIPDRALSLIDQYRLSICSFFPFCDFTYTEEQYTLHIAQLQKMAQVSDHLKVCFVSKLSYNVMLYVKENAGVIMAKSSAPQTAFVINERNMVSAFWDYLEKCVINVCSSSYPAKASSFF